MPHSNAISRIAQKTCHAQLPWQWSGAESRFSNVEALSCSEVGRAESREQAT